MQEYAEYGQRTDTRARQAHRNYDFRHLTLFDALREANSGRGTSC